MRTVIEWLPKEKFESIENQNRDNPIFGYKSVNQGKETPCGGCGAKTERERCINCFHDFNQETK